MSVEDHDSLNSYIAGVEDTCRLMRKNLGLSRTEGSGNAEHSTSPLYMESPSSGRSIGDGLTGIDLTNGDSALHSDEPSMEDDALDPTPVLQPRQARKKFKRRKVNHYRHHERRVVKRTHHQIRDWDQKFYSVLKGKDLIGSAIFNELHTKKLIRFKGAAKKDKMYRCFRKTLLRLQKKGLIEQVSNAFNAPWHWIGGALMVGYRRKGEDTGGNDGTTIES